MFTYVTVIRGYVSRSAAVKEATGRLIEHLVGEPAHSVLITIQMDIAPQHHLFMIGRNGMNIKHIMTRTGANIQFPDAESSQRNKSAVFITGTIDSVCLAREQLIGCLPLVLMFDLKDETGTVMNDIVGLAQLMEALDVFISVKPKPKQLSKSVIVKTVERNAHNMYYARVYLLEKDPSSKVEIESPVGTGDFPFSSETSPPLFAQPSLIPLQGGVPQYSSIGNGRIASDKKSGGRVPPGLIHIKQHMMDLSLSTGSSSALSLSSSGVDFPDTPLSLSSSDHSLSTGSLGSVGLHSSPQRAHWPTGPSNMEFLKSNALLREPMRTSVAISPPDADLTDSGLGAEHISPPNSQSCSLSPSHGSPVQLSGHSPSPLCDDGMELISERKDRLSNVVGSCGSMSPDSAFPDKRILSHPYEGLSSLHQGHGAQLQLYPEKHMKLTQCGNIVLESQIDYRDVDYERRRRMASEAMKKPVITQEVRFPTDIWSGMGFSKSMPESAIREQLRRRGKIMKEPDMVTAFEEEETFDFLRQRNQYDPPGIKHAGRNSDQEFSFGPVGTPAYDGSLKPFLQQDNDLVDLLTRIGLAKYATLFEDQEVDLNTFLTLGDRDLKELGVSTFGARKKMLLAIADVQGRPLGSHHIDSSLIVGSSINSGSNKYPYDHTVGSRRDMMSMSGRW
jgi:protein bicaudal C